MNFEKHESLSQRIDTNTAVWWFLIAGNGTKHEWNLEEREFIISMGTGYSELTINWLSTSYFEDKES